MGNVVESKKKAKKLTASEYVNPMASSEVISALKDNMLTLHRLRKKKKDRMMRRKVSYPPLFLLRHGGRPHKFAFPFWPALLSYARLEPY